MISWEELRELGLKVGAVLLIVVLPGGVFLAPFLMMALRRATRGDRSRILA